MYTSTCFLFLLHLPLLLKVSQATPHLIAYVAGPFLKECVPKRPLTRSLKAGSVIISSRHVQIVFPAFVPNINSSPSSGKLPRPSSLMNTPRFRRTHNRGPTAPRTTWCGHANSYVMFLDHLS